MSIVFNPDIALRIDRANEFVKSKKIHLDKLITSKSELIDKIELYNKELNTLTIAKDTYSKAIELVYDNSIGQLEKTINQGLKYVFYDKDYKVKFELGDRVNKTLSITLIDNEQNLETDLKNGTGAGVRSVISITLLMYYLLAKKSYPVLFLDESYSQVSAEYVERFFEYLRGFTESKKFIIVMITHDPRFVNYCDKEYKIVDGKLIEEVDR